MQTYVARYSAGGWIVRASAAWLERVDAWLDLRRKSAAHSEALCAMSARELRDIGLDPGLACAPEADAWVRDWRV